MKELLQKIGSAEIGNISQLDDLCSVVKEYYTNNKRHKYSEVSSYLMENADIEYLLENLRRIQERLGEHEEDEVFSEKVFKLIDHITLELNRTKFNSSVMQADMMNTAISGVLKEVNQSIDEVRKEQSQKMDFEIDEFRNETRALKDKVEDSYSQFVSILGIFSAIVLVFFGGMTAFNAIFANMQYIGRFKLVFTISLVGLIVFNLIFMFLYVLAKLLKREIIASSGDDLITGKGHFVRWLKRVWSRYPYMIMFNVMMFIIMTVSFAAWYGATYYGWKI